MDNLKVGDVVAFCGTEIRIARILPGGYFIRGVRELSYGQFFSDWDMRMARERGGDVVRFASDPAPDSGKARPDPAFLDHVRRHVADAICDAALRCLGPDAVPVARVHRELLAALNRVQRAALLPPSLNKFRGMVKCMAGAVAERSADATAVARTVPVEAPARAPESQCSLPEPTSTGSTPERHGTKPEEAYMPRIKLKVGDVIGYKEGDEYQVPRMLPDALPSLWEPSVDHNQVLDSTDIEFARRLIVFGVHFKSDRPERSVDRPAAQIRNEKVARPRKKTSSVKQS